MVCAGADELEQFAESVLSVLRNEEPDWRCGLLGGAGLVGVSVGDCADAGANLAEHYGDVFGTRLFAAISGLAAAGASDIGGENAAGWSTAVGRSAASYCAQLIVTPRPISVERASSNADNGNQHCLGGRES